jgi:hypothetical protein
MRVLGFLAAYIFVVSGSTLQIDVKAIFTVGVHIDTIKYLNKSEREKKRRSFFMLQKKVNMSYA